MSGAERPGAPPLSIVIPAYNEARRLPPYLKAIRAYLTTRGISYEIVVVDDGSRDGTGAVVEEIGRREPSLRLLTLPRNRGKGCAVRTGILAARGALCLIADADGATPIEELARLESALAEGADLAIGSRFRASRDPRYRVRARWHRSVLGNLFNWCVRRLGIPDIDDTQCGFKLLPASVARDLFSVARIDGYGFDLELLYLARKRGYTVAEVAINWADQPGSKVWVLRDGLRMFLELLAVRRNDARGVYARLT